MRKIGIETGLKKFFQRKAALSSRSAPAEGEMTLGRTFPLVTMQETT